MIALKVLLIRPRKPDALLVELVLLINVGNNAAGNGVVEEVFVVAVKVILPFLLCVIDVVSEEGYVVPSGRVVVVVFVVGLNR